MNGSLKIYQNCVITGEFKLGPKQYRYILSFSELEKIFKNPFHPNETKRFKKKIESNPEITTLKVTSELSPN